MTDEQRRRVLWGPLRLLGVLLLLLGCTVAYAYAPWSAGKPGVNLSIGVGEAMVIALLFMELPRTAGIVRVAAVVGVVWASFLYLFAFADYLTR